VSNFDEEAARALIAAELVAADDKPAFSGWLQRMCRAAARDLPAAGVGVSLADDEGSLMTAAASNATSVLVEELQFTLGEGPCLQAYDSRGPVLVPDLTAAELSSWPVYAAAAQDHGVRAVFAFPLQIGVTRLGAMDVYRGEPGELSADALGRALTFAEVTMGELLGAQSRADDSGDWLDDLAQGGYRIYQAQGMVMIQLDVSAREALVRLRAYAFAHERRLSDVADDVLSRRLKLESDDSTGWDDEGDDRS
jgi:hypothetical protein